MVTLVFACVAMIFAVVTTTALAWQGFDCSKPTDGSDGTDVGQRECRCPPVANETRRVRWLHIPKTGTTFGNTVFRTACGLPAHASMRAKPGTSLSKAPHGMYIPYFQACFPRAMTRCRLDGGPRLNMGHHELRGMTSSTAYVTLFRDPYERLVSSFHDNYHDCKSCRGMPIVLYARRARGVYAKFLLGTAATSASAAIDAAVRRLGRFAFVGIVEHWAASVCLYHAIFGGGGAPTNAEFRAVRKSSAHNATSLADLAATLRHDARKRHRAEDDLDLSLVDEAIYDAALARFTRDRAAYESRCAPHREHRGVRHSHSVGDRRVAQKQQQQQQYHHHRTQEDNAG